MNLSFPHMASYSVPIEMFLRFVFPRHNVILPPTTTEKTVALGAKHSPDFVCAPFKYNLGNYIEALEAGADVLFGAGGGCRYGYYGELHEEILKSLGYKFSFVNLFSCGTSLPSLYKTCKRFGTPLGLPSFVYYALLTIKIIKLMDDFDVFIRENIGFEKEKGSFAALRKEFLKDIKSTKNFRSLFALKKNYRAKFATVPLCVPKNPLRIGLIGELYGLMEPAANFGLERMLAQYNASLTRFVNLSYLLFDAKKEVTRLIKKSEGYLKYHIGADGTASVANGRKLAAEGYDGLIHIKPFGCTPEVNAMPVLMNISEDYKIPVLYLSFDSQNSETGIKTRIEAFCDMLTMKKEKENEILLGS